MSRDLDLSRAVRFPFGCTGTRMIGVYLLENLYNSLCLALLVASIFAGTK